MEIRCIKGMYRLELVSGEKNSGIKGLIPADLIPDRMYLKHSLQETKIELTEACQKKNSLARLSFSLCFHEEATGT